MGFNKVLYLKATCPFCQKVMVALGELGCLKDIDLQEDSEENRKMLEDKLGKKPTFPTMEVEEGKYVADSDEIIDMHCKEKGVAREDLIALKFYMNGLFPAYKQMVKHIGYDKIAEVLAKK
mmetsp:Transcript_1559/g.2380  ORF Transcript_1559/g.2380 Transcript_1559/m.2380 type:complete len:121 (+) Transcript_1559:94-456(+)